MTEPTEEKAPAQLPSSPSSDVRLAREQLREVTKRLAPLTKDHVAGSAIARRLVDVVNVIDAVAHVVERVAVAVERKRAE